MRDAHLRITHYLAQAYQIRYYGSTITVPTIPFCPSGVPCSWQKYRNVPAVLKVELLDSPGWNNPVSNDLSTAVAECGAAPSFFQVIVVPTLTLISLGPNSKSLIETVTLAAAGAAAAVAGGAVGLAACAPPPSPTLITPDIPPPPAPPWNSQK